MSSGRLLVMALNLRGPMPNAAAINSHRPNSVLLIRSKSNSEWGEDSLNESYERLQAWANGTLPELYEFDPDIDLTKAGKRHTPEAPTTIPQIEVLEVGGLSSSSEKICEKITSICDSQADLELRIDVAAGRKEDAAILARLPDMADLEGGCTVWYTDATSGISVEIAGEIVEDGERPLSHMTRFWLNGTPILGFNNILWAKEMKGSLLSSVLDSVEKANKSPNKNQTQRMDILIQDLYSRGINIDSGLICRMGQEDGGIRLPRLWTPEDGFWLEELAALAIVDGWDCEHVYIGISIGHHKHENRMRSLKSKLGYRYGGESLSRVWSELRAEGILPPEFSGLDFLDPLSFNMEEYEKIHHPANLTEIKRFAARAVRDWSEFPLSLREYLTPHCKTRDLDVFAETVSNCLFVECKLSPEGMYRSVEENKAQIDSIVASSASRGVNYSILTHNRHDIDTWRSGVFDYIVPWSELRRPDGLLKSVIKGGYLLEEEGRLLSRGAKENAGVRSRRRKRPRGVLAKSRRLAHNLKDKLEKGDVSPEEAFKLLFESIMAGGQGNADMSATGNQNPDAAVDLGSTIVMLKDKSGMSKGTTAQIVGFNKTQWKLSNGKTVQRDQYMEAWAIEGGEEE